MGLALAILLTRKGADVSIVARNEERLQAALEEVEVRPCVPFQLSPVNSFVLLQKARQTPNQVLRAYSFSLSDAVSSAAALEAACQSHGGRNPDAVFLCAGCSTPGFFIEQDEASLRQGMDGGYWVQAWSALVSPLAHEYCALR